LPPRLYAPGIQVAELSIADMLPSLAVARSEKNWKEVLRVNRSGWRDSWPERVALYRRLGDAPVEY
jgi:hypothetical protein